MKITAYFDGACEPVNPGGTAAFGAVIFIDDKKVWELSKIFVPIKGRERETSNNIAEYSGFLSILDYLIEHNLQHEDITIYGDSMLVLCQTLMDDPKWHKRWQIKQGFYVPLAHKALARLKLFTNIKGQWIPREENSIADELSKRELINAGIRFAIQPNDKPQSTEKAENIDKKTESQPNIDKERSTDFMVNAVTSGKGKLFVIKLRNFCLKNDISYMRLLCLIWQNNNKRKCGNKNHKKDKYSNAVECEAQVAQALHMYVIGAEATDEQLENLFNDLTNFAKN